MDDHSNECISWHWHSWQMPSSWFLTKHLILTLLIRANARSLVLVLEIKLVVIHELKIMYESVFESDEIVMLV